MLKWRQLSPLIDALAKRTDSDSDFQIAAGSSLAGDDQISEPYQVSHAVRMCLTAAADHLHALKCLVVDLSVLHVAAPASLARGVLENTATAFWILHPSRRDDRLTRALMWYGQNFKDQHKALESSQSLTSSSLDEKLSKLETVARRRQLNTVSIRRGYRSTNVVRYADEELSHLPLGVMLPWQVCSGFAHGRPWAYLGVCNLEKHSTTEANVTNVRLTNDAARSLYPTLAGVQLLEELLGLFEQRS